MGALAKLYCCFSLGTLREDFPKQGREKLRHSWPVSLETQTSDQPQSGGTPLGTPHHVSTSLGFMTFLAGLLVQP